MKPAASRGAGVGAGWPPSLVCVGYLRSPAFASASLTAVADTPAGVW